MIGIDSKICANAFANLAHVGFVDRAEHLHLREIVCNREKRWRLQARGNGLADIDVARDDYAVYRRSNDCMFEIDFRLVELSL